MAGSASPFAAHADPQATTIPDGDADGLDDDFVIAREPHAVARLVSTIRSSRRNMAIAAGAAGLLVIVSALAFCGGGSSGKSKQIAASERSNAGSARSPASAREPALAPEPVEAAKPAAVPVAPDRVGSAAAEPTEATGPTAEELAAAAEPSEPAPIDASATAPKRDASKATSGKTSGTSGAATPTSGGKKLGGKQVVLEYDTQARETKPVASAPKSEQAAIQKARSAYASGNQRLFAGDPTGAIKFYRQSLASYPGYVAGYRGLGLAYAQQGDKPKALQALRTYVSSVPTAKDAALIRKRISSL